MSLEAFSGALSLARSVVMTFVLEPLLGLQQFGLHTFLPNQQFFVLIATVEP